MAFNIFTTKRISCFGQYDRIDDLIPGKLRGDKRPVFRQFLVDEFHSPAVFKCFDPLLVWHFRPMYAAEEEADATTAWSSRVYLARPAQRLGSLPLSGRIWPSAALPGLS